MALRIKDGTVQSIAQPTSTQSPATGLPASANPSSPGAAGVARPQATLPDTLMEALNHFASVSGKKHSPKLAVQSYKTGRYYLVKEWDPANSLAVLTTPENKKMQVFLSAREAVLYYPVWK